MMAPSASKSGTASITSEIPDSSLSPLLSLLEEMIQVHQELLSLLQQEKRLIIDGEAGDLVRCLGEKEGVLGRLIQLEQKREKETGLLARQSGKGDEPLSLKQMIPLVSETNQSRLRSCQVRLEALTTSIHEINQMNGILVERILQQIIALLGLLRQMTAHSVTYQPTGMISGSPFDGKTIGRG